MQVESEVKKTDEKIRACLQNSGKRYFRCAGIIKNKRSWLYGKPCRKVLAEANDRGQLHGKIKCPHCGHINEV